MFEYLLNQTPETATFAVRLQKGEPLVSTLLKWCESKNIVTAFLQGIGALLEGEIGYYDLPNRRYSFEKISGPVEIASLTGNITQLEEGALHAHIHVVLSDPQGKALGGHLKEGVVGGTCELYLTSFSTTLRRKNDPETNLNLWDI